MKYWMILFFGLLAGCAAKSGQAASSMQVSCGSGDKQFRCAAHLNTVYPRTPGTVSKTPKLTITWEPDQFQIWNFESECWNHKDNVVCEIHEDNVEMYFEVKVLTSKKPDPIKLTFEGENFYLKYSLTP